MIATGVRYVIGGDPQRAYESGGWLKPVHAVLMHGILVLPLLAWLVMRLGWNGRAQMQAMRAAIAAYLLVIVAAVVIVF